MSAFNHNKPPLPEDYTPTDHCVVVGKGKKFYLHPGNILLRNTVSSMLTEYSKANTKAGKSEIISDVVEQVNLKGAFVRRGDNGQWVYAEDRLCREKCSQTFRDALHETYRSSSKAKKIKRRRENEDAMVDATPSLVSTGAISQENKRRRLLEAAPLSIPSHLFDFDVAIKLDAPRPMTMRRASMASGNGDLVSLLTDMLALPSLDEDSNPFEPTPIQDVNLVSGADAISSCVGNYDDFPPLSCESFDRNGAWFQQEASRSTVPNMAAAFAA